MFSKQQQTIEQIRQFNGCAAKGDPCETYSTVYSSPNGAAVGTFIHPFGHIYPPPVTSVIVKFFQEHPQRS